MLKKLRTRFIFFNMLIISCVLCILALFVFLRSKNNLSTDRFVSAVLFSLLIVFIGSFAISKFAILPIKNSWQKQLDFTADASHELRTPLTVIKTNLEIIMDSPNEIVKSQIKWLKNMEAEQKRMTKLVDNLLTLSRADTGEDNIHKTVFLLDKSIENIVTTFQSICDQKNIQFRYDIEPGISFTGDETRIAQLIVILLDNSYQYTKADGHITLSLYRKEKKLKLIISDTGTGISNDDLEKIFNRFYRASNTRQQNPDGSGLGLSIAKWIVDQHNGSIDVKSNLEKGTIFFVNFPI